MAKPESMQGKAVGPYKITGQLGTGAFATVYRAQHTQTMTDVALKQIPKANLKTQREFELIQREVNLMKSMDHPFIATFYEVLDDKANFYIAIEVVEGGNLLDYINARHGLSEDQARGIFVQLITVLDYLHNVKHCCHRDIKAENVLLDACGNIRLVDFGLSKGFTQANPFLQTTCGSPAYVAPEIVLEKPYTSAADVWSAGVLLYAMVCGRLPFHDENLATMLQMILSSPVRLPRSLSPPLKQLLSRLLAKDAGTRITIPGIKREPWLADAFGAWPDEYLATLRILDMPELDETVLAEMRTLGVGLDGLRQEVVDRKVNSRTAVYRQLRRAVVNKELENRAKAKAAGGSRR